MIDEEIKEKRVEAFDAYVKESKASRNKRVKEAKKEAKEAEEMAVELGVEEKLFGNGTTNGNSKNGKNAKKGEPDMSGLTALIQQRQKDRASTFLDDLEAKYAPKKGGRKNKRAAGVEPPEEVFQRNKKKKARKTSDAGAEEEVEVERPRTKRARRA